MKQTNSTLTFLQAQYRAVFKNAYFKGLTSALVLTTGLAAAQDANAANFGATDWESLNENDVINIDGFGTNINNYQYIDITGKAHKQAINSTVKITGGTIENNKITTPDVQGSFVNIELSGTNTGLSINGSGSVVIKSTTITNNATLQLQGSNTGTANLSSRNDSITLNQGNLNLKGNTSLTALFFNATTVDGITANDSTITVSGAGNSIYSFWYQTDYISNSNTFKNSSFTLENNAELAFIIGDYIFNNSSTLSIGDNATLNIGSTYASAARAATVTIDGSSLTFGTGSNVNLDSGSLIVKGSTVDLRNAMISGASASAANNNVIADSGAVVTLKSNFFSDGDAANAIYKAINGGTFVADSLSIASTQFTDGTAAGGVHIDADSFLKVGELTISDSTGDVSITNNAGTVIVTSKISNAADSLAFTSNAKLQLGDTTAPTDHGVVDASLKISDNPLNVYGHWFTNASKKVAVNGGTLTINADSSLTIANAGEFEINGASSKVDGTGSLILSGGKLNVVDASVDLSKLAKIQGSGNSVVVIADSANASVTVTDFADLAQNLYRVSGNAGYEAVLKGATLTAKVTDFKNPANVETAGIQVGANGTLEVDILNLTGSGNAIIDMGGVVQVNKSINGDNDISFTGGTLQLGLDDGTTTNGVIDGTLVAKNNVNVLGSWSGKTATVDAGGTLNVGTATTKGSLTLDSLAFASQTNNGVMVNSGSTLTLSGELNAGAIDTTNKLNTIGLADSATLNADSLKLTSDGTATIQATIGLKSLDLGGTAKLANLKNVTVSELLNNSTSSPIDLGSTIKLYQASGATSASIISGAGFNLSSGKTFDINGNWLAQSKIAVNGADLSLDSGDSLTFSGTAAAFSVSNNGNVQVRNGGILAFDQGVAVTLNGGSFTADKATIDLSQITGTVSGSNSLTAINDGLIKFGNNLASAQGAKFTASSGGRLQTDSLSIAAADISSGTGTRFNINNNGILEANILSLTDDKALNVGGTLQVNRSFGAGSNAVTLNKGILQLGFTDGSTTDGVLSSDLNIKGSSTVNVLGAWNGGGKNVTLNSGNLNIGNEVKSGSLTAATLSSDTSSKISVNQGSTMRIEGVATSDISGGTAGYYGFGLNGVKVNVNGGTFIIGGTAADHILGTWNTGADADNSNYVYDNFGLFDLKNSGILQLDFGSSTTLTLAQFNQIKTELFGSSNITSGTLKLGNAKIDGIDDIINSGSSGGSGGSGSSGNLSLDFSTYQQNSILFANHSDATINATQLQGVNGELDRTHFGSIKLTNNGNVTFVGDSSLNKNDSGNLVLNANGSVGNATLASTASLTLNDNGAIADLTMARGADSDQNITLLRANNTNNFNSIREIGATDESSSLNNTKLIVGSETATAAKAKVTVARGIQVAEVVNNGTLTVGTGSTGNGGTGTGTTGIKARSLRNTGDLAVNVGNIDLAGYFTNSKTVETNSGDIAVAESMNTTADSVTTARTIHVDGGNSTIGASVAGGTLTVTHNFDYTAISSPETANDNPLEALDHRNIAGFYFDSQQRIDDHSDIIQARIIGDVNAETTTAYIAHTDIVDGGDVQARTALFGDQVVVNGNVDAKRTIIGYADYDDVVVNTNGTVNYAKRRAAAGDVSITGSATLGELHFLNGTYETADAKNRKGLHIYGGNVTTTDVNGTAGAIITVGSEASGTNKSKSGTLEIAGVLRQAGTTLVVDPEYGEDTALMAIRNLDDHSHTLNYIDMGVFNGNVYVGQNSALGVGVSLEQLRNLIAPFQKNGSLLDPRDNEDAYGSILYLDGFTRLNRNYGITLTAESIATTRHRLGLTDDNYALANTIYLGSNTALAINTERAVDNSTAYIRFVETTGTGTDSTEVSATDSKVIADGGEILLYGKTFRKQYRLFEEGNVTVTGLKGTEGVIAVSSINGLFEGTLTNEDQGLVELNLNQDHAQELLNGASAATQKTMLAYYQGYNGERRVDATGKDITDYLYTYDANGHKVYDVNNEFLSQVLLGGTGADVEKVARLGVYGGAAQSALTAGMSTADAISGRMGVGANGTNLTVADNMQGGAVWITPIYKNSDSDGFNAGGVGYGVDMDLYGLTLGGDYTLENGFRFGAAFNIGSGDADGEGAGEGVNNDFDYYGFAVYGGYSYGPWSVVADLSYTTVDNDVEVNTNVGKGNASFDSTSLSFGVTGQYQALVNDFNVTPHAGLRFTRIDLDDYTIHSEDNYDIASYEADSMNVFSIPVGVTLSKDFINGDWTVKPSFDLTLTYNFGDQDAEGTTHWSHIENLSTTVVSEVLDNFTYGASVGIAAKTGNFSLGLGINYTGSSNTDEFGVNANARFVF